MNINDERILKIKDPKFYLENFCQIKTKSKGLQPFKLNEAQKDIFNALRKNKRVIILKARQIGFSTAITGFFYHKTITVPGTTTALIGYNSSLTAELLDKVKTFWRTTPKAIRPTITINNKYEIGFPKVNSKILVLPSTETVGRGYTITNCLLTELAFWDKAEEKMSALEDAVPIDGQIVVESTPNGIGNLYHRMWTSDDNDYVKKEYGWWCGYTAEEFEIIKKRKNNPMKVAQEYECAFLSSGRSVFNQIMLRELRKNVLEVGDVNGDFTVREEDDWVIYSEPKKDKLYVCGVDISEGIQGGDNSVAVIFDRMTGEEVAKFKGLVAPDLLANKLDKMGRKYNNALMVLEINNHGLTTMTVMKQLIYPSLYYRPSRYETISSRISDKIGWQTNKKTRPILIDDFNQAVRDNEVLIHSKDILDEMTVFVYDENNDMVPQPGFHDDCVFSAAIAWQGFKVLYDKPLTQLDYADHMPKSFAY